MDISNIAPLAKLKRAYGILNKQTPMSFDCGLLCGRRCCSGGPDHGMHLYPGEEILLDKVNFLREIRNETLNGLSISYAVCKGNCLRRLRPLSCRIFPLVPYISSKGDLYIIEDPRARYLCPLIMNFEQLKIRRNFKRKVYHVFRLLIEDPKIEAYVKELSAVLNDYAKFTGVNLDNLDYTF